MRTVICSILATGVFALLAASGADSGGGAAPAAGMMVVDSTADADARDTVASSLPPPPRNDDFANATVISSLPFSDSNNTLGATTEPGEPSPCGDMQNTVWYSFTTSPLITEADTFGSNFDTALAAYFGTDLASVRLITCNNNSSVSSRIRFLVPPGTTVHFQVGGFPGSSESPSLQLNLRFLDTDFDGDGVADSLDNCIHHNNPGQEDLDGDGADADGDRNRQDDDQPPFDGRSEGGNVCDADIDGDGFDNFTDPDDDNDNVPDASDFCAGTISGATLDTNGCSQGQVDEDLDGACDPGKSSPRWCTGADNCPKVPNSDQHNTDGEGGGDVCSSHITVNGTGDTDTRDGVLTLRETMLLATGVLALGALDDAECGQVLGAAYGPPCQGVPVGEAIWDRITFDSAVFPSASPATIALNGGLPVLDTGDDTVDASGAGVTVNGAGGVIRCFDLRGAGNTVRYLHVTECGTGVYADGPHRIIGIVATLNQTGVRFTRGRDGGISTLEGSYIGIDPSGQVAAGNATGVEVSPEDGVNHLGGPAESQRNVISGNGRGIYVPNGRSVVENNYIGTDATGTFAVPNTYGILLATENSGATIRGNLISGNEKEGVYLGSSGRRLVVGNVIGLNAGGDPLGNGGAGIFTEGYRDVIGGPSPADRNVIAANEGDGIVVGHVHGQDIIQGNFIGVGLDGVSPRPNGLNGISVDSEAGNVIGGTGAGEANVIANNGANGVILTNGYDSGPNTIRGNSIHSNALRGIALPPELDCVPAPCRPGPRPNEGILPPLITGVDPVRGTTCALCTVDVYSDDEDEGRIHHGSTTANALGEWSYGGAVTGPNVTATATDSVGNTSEFSAPLPLVLSVEIEVRPGTNDNRVSLSRNSVVPIAVLSGDGLDATTVLPESVLFEGAGAELWRRRDVDGDGDLDLWLRFRTRETDIELGDTKACLTGLIPSGQAIAGCDSVLVRH